MIMYNQKGDLFKPFWCFKTIHLLKNYTKKIMTKTSTRNPFVRIYPVFNGSLSLIKTSSGKTILIDCKITKAADDPENQDYYDSKSDLLEYLEKDSNGNPFLDLFILTHPDQDHCHGFETHFYTGKPADYSKEDKEGNKILMEEMWVTKIIYGEVCDDAKCIQKEVDRRRDLYSSNDRSSETTYNRLTMIGYDTDDTFGNCPYHIPGNLVTYFAGVEHTDIEIFVHSPFKKSLIESNANDDRNLSSIVCQYRLMRPDSEEYLNYLEGGDADHYRWKTIKEKTENNDNQDRLKFDVFLAPHHCSWTFYNDVSYKDNKTPQASSKDLIKDYKDANRNSYIVSSCKEIIDNEDNPPHHPAKKEYIKDLGRSDTFLCTAEEPTKADPKPIQFTLKKDGWIKGEETAESNSSNSRPQKAAVLYPTSVARSYGRK